MRLLRLGVPGERPLSTGDGITRGGRRRNARKARLRALEAARTPGLHDREGFYPVFRGKSLHDHGALHPRLLPLPGAVLPQAPRPAAGDADHRHDGEDADVSAETSAAPSDPADLARRHVEDRPAVSLSTAQMLACTATLSLMRGTTTFWIRHDHDGTVLDVGRRRRRPGPARPREDAFIPPPSASHRQSSIANHDGALAAHRREPVTKASPRTQRDPRDS